jgi:hypothetical protein
MRSGIQRHAPATLPPGKARYSFYRRLGGPQSRYGRVRKISPPPEFDPRTVQPVASFYTDYDIPTPKHTYIYTCIYKHIYIHAYTYTHTNIQTHIHTSVHTLIRIYIYCIYISTHRPYIYPSSIIYIQNVFNVTTRCEINHTDVQKHKTTQHKISSGVQNGYIKLEALQAMKIHVLVFREMTVCSS